MAGATFRTPSHVLNDNNYMNGFGPDVPSFPNELIAYDFFSLPGWSPARLHGQAFAVLGNGLPNANDYRQQACLTRTPTYNGSQPHGTKPAFRHTYSAATSYNIDEKLASSSFGDSPAQISSVTEPHHGIIFGSVDSRPYTYIDEEELALAEIDYDPSSPGSIYGPYTPTAKVELSFVDSACESYSSRPHLFAGLPETDYSPSLHATGHMYHGTMHYHGQRGPFASCNPLMQSAFTTSKATHHIPVDYTYSIPGNYSVPEVSPRFVGVENSFVASETDDDEDDGMSTISSPLSKDERSEANMARQNAGQGVAPASSSFSTEGSYADSDETDVDPLRTKKEHLLVTLRQSGMSYREIKQRAGFVEAESTLRGKYRMLTKSKSERVRRPEWTPRDIELLRHAVARFYYLRPARVTKQNQRPPWKKISEYIKESGGSYLFAPATCARKWESLGEGTPPRA